MDIASKEFEETYSIESLIGEGGFGTVQKLKNIKDHMEYAGKFIKLPEDSEKRKQFLKAKDCLRSLAHDNIAQVFHFSTYREKLDGNL